MRQINMRKEFYAHSTTLLNTLCCLMILAKWFSVNHKPPWISLIFSVLKLIVVVSWDIWLTRVWTESPFSDMTLWYMGAYRRLTTNWMARNLLFESSGQFLVSQFWMIARLKVSEWGQMSPNAAPPNFLPFARLRRIQLFSFAQRFKSFTV